MLIFHKFPNRECADAFAIAVRDSFGCTTRFFDSQEESDKFDPFPFELTSPIVLVERGDLELELKIESLVTQFNGEFAGT